MCVSTAFSMSNVLSLAATCQARGKQMKRSERDVVEQNNFLQSMVEVAHLFAEYHRT